MCEQKDEVLTVDGIRIILPTPEEDAEINAQIAADPDDFELDDEWFAKAKPTSELFPEIYRRAMQRKADLESGILRQVYITLPASVVAYFKAQAGLDGETDGTAWIGLIEQALAAYVLEKQEGMAQPEIPWDEEGEESFGPADPADFGPAESEGLDVAEIPPAPVSRTAGG